MPSVRSWILIAISIAVLSLLLAWVSLFQTPDSDGMGRDTFGTREAGYRAIFETLNELDVPVHRQFHPPVPLSEEQSLVFLNPNPQLCGTEPAYLHDLLPWVEAGGHLVVATGAAILDKLQTEGLSQAPVKLPGIFESLDLADVQFDLIEVDWQNQWREWEREDSVHSLFKDFHRELTPPRLVEVQCAGTFAPWQNAIKELALSGDREQGLIWEKTEPIGRISYVTEEEEECVIAAEFARGKGKILVVDESVFRNRLLPLGDNSVAAAYLMSPHGTLVVFDEFYHGLGVRGNPLYLLTLPGYAALALGLLLWVGLNSWRKAVFLGPALPDELQTRRNIGEYLTAMGQFFSQGRNARRFLIRQIREGVVRELNMDYALPPESPDVELVTSLMARKDPERAQEVRKALEEADRLVNSPGAPSKAQTLEAIRRLTACL